MPNLAVRMLIGLALGFGFGMAGMFSAWFVYLFAVPRSSTVMLAMLMIGGGIGAGAASVVSWADLRHNRRRSVIIGFEAFKFLMNDSRFTDVSMILETRKARKTIWILRI